MKVSFAITVSTEYDEIKKLIPFLIENKRVNDEIVVLYDSKNGDENVLNFLLEFNKLPNVQVWSSGSFDNHFADWKNKLNSYCDGDYIFQLDADEMLNETMVKNIDQFIDLNKEIDLFYFPRINTVDGITDEHVKEWRWKLDEQKRINFPDYQGRLYRKGLNWDGKVHEKIVGAKYYSLLPDSETSYCIIHNKNIKKQEKQNNYYSTL
jgi:hypothetical protein